MFDIGWSELLVIAVVAIVVIGPKELPRLMRTFGQYTGKIRRAAAEFQRQFEDAVRESEFDELRKAAQEMQATTADLSQSISKPLMTETPPAAAAGPSTLKPAPPPPQIEAKPKGKGAAKTAGAKKAAPAKAKAKAARKPRQPKGESS